VLNWSFCALGGAAQGACSIAHADRGIWQMQGAAPAPVTQPRSHRNWIERISVTSGVRWLAVLALLLAGCASGSHGAAVAPPAARPRPVATPAPGHPTVLSADVVLPSDTMPAGSAMAGQVLVDNDTGHAVHVAGCLALFQVVLTSSTYRPAVAWATCLQQFTIPPGQTRYRVTLTASYSQCSQGRPRDGLRACLPDGRMPPLPPGTYQARLFQVRKLVQGPPAVTVRVTLPGHR